MRGPAIALASVAGLAGLGLLRRGGGTWGSRATRRLTLVDVERAIRADDEDFLLVQNPHGADGVTLGHVYNWVPRWDRVSDMEAAWVLSAAHALTDFLDGLSFPLVVYRGLLRDEGSTVRFQGEHWTTSLGVARAFADGTHENQIDYGYDVKEQEASRAPPGTIAKKEAIVLVGLLRHPGLVRWDEVHQYFLLFSIDYEGGWIAEKNPRKTEREVCLDKGALAEILEVRRFRAPARPGHRWLSDQHLGKE